MGAFAAIGVAVLIWSYFARSAQSGAGRANIETATRLTRISETIQITSREDYQAARELRQWAVDLDRHNATALANLTFANTTLKTFGPTIGTAAFNSKMERVREGLRLAGLPE